MLTHAQLARIARRYRTLMAYAMLRALGEEAPRPEPPAGVPVPVEWVDPDVLWCFENHGSPMDLMR